MPIPPPRTDLQRALDRIRAIADEHRIVVGETMCWDTCWCDDGRHGWQTRSNQATTEARARGWADRYPGHAIQRLTITLDAPWEVVQ
jgi:hypothetical protein